MSAPAAGVAGTAAAAAAAGTRMAAAAAAGWPEYPLSLIAMCWWQNGCAARQPRRQSPRLGSFRVGFKFCLSGQKDYGADRLTGGVVCSDLRLKRVCVCVCV